MRCLKLLFFTSDKVSMACLQAMAAGGELLAVVQAGPALKPLPFIADPAKYFRELEIPFLQHTDLANKEFQTLLARADLLVSIGYGRVIPESVYSVPPFGSVNLHPSYLPQYRGNHPDIRALMNGEREVGITLHYLDSGIDTGAIIAQ